MNMRRVGNAERYYIVLPKKNSDIKYSEKMLLNSRIEYLLQMSVRHMDGIDSYYYDAGSRLSLTEYVEEKNLNQDEIAALFMGISNMLSRLSEHLLRTDGLMLSPDYIMMDSNGPEFCYYPEAGEEGGDFKSLAEYLLQVTDYEDEAAVKMVYDYYELVCGGVIDPGNVVIMPDIDAAKEEGMTENPESNEEINKSDEVSFYFRELEEEEEKINVNNAIKPLAIACAVVLVLGGIYIFLFLNPEILAGLGMEKSDYIVAAAVLCGVLSVLVAFMIHKLLVLRSAA